MPAQARKVHEDMNTELQNPDTIEEYDVVCSLPWYYRHIAGVQYIKKGRACSQITQVRPPSISGVDPNSYSKRFVKFLECVFPEQD
jgi:1-phosphatidylinositol-4-phosphate 5-kinase